MWDALPTIHTFYLPSTYLHIHLPTFLNPIFFMMSSGTKMSKHDELKKQMERLITAVKGADEEFDSKVKLQRDQIRDLMKEKIDFRNKYEAEIKKTVELDNKIIEAEKTIREGRRFMRDHQDMASRYQELVSKYDEAKQNEKKLSDVLNKTIVELEAMTKEKEDAVKALNSMKDNFTPTSKPPNELGSEGPSTHHYGPCDGVTHSTRTEDALTQEMFDLEDLMIPSEVEDDGDDEMNDEMHEGDGSEGSPDAPDEPDEPDTPDAILAQCLELLSVENHVQLLSMLSRYKQQKDGQKEAIQISVEMKKKRQECRKHERKLKGKVEQNERHQKQYIDEKGYPKVVDSVKNPRPGKRQREAMKAKKQTVI